MSCFRPGLVQQIALSAFLALCTLSFSRAQIDATKVTEAVKPVLVTIKGVTEGGDVRSGSGFIVHPSVTQLFFCNLTESDLRRDSPVG